MVERSELATINQRDAVATPGSANPYAGLPEHVVMMKMENEQIMAAAVTRRRSLAEMMAEIEAQLKAYPAMAEGLIYSKPVGRGDDTCADCGEASWRQGGRMRETCYHCGSANMVPGEMNFASDLSIRAAELLAEVQGFNRIEAAIEPADDMSKATIRAVYVDYANGRVWNESTVVSRSYTNKRKETIFHDVDRFLSVVCKAQSSKVIREVVCRSVNAGLRQFVKDKVREVTSGLLTPERVDQIIKAFERKGVPQKAIEKLLGRTKSNGWDEQDRTRLLEIYNAIEAGEAVASVFQGIEGVNLRTGDDEPAAPIVPESAAGGVSLLGGGGEKPKEPPKVEDKPKPAAVEKPADDVPRNKTGDPDVTLDDDILTAAAENAKTRASRPAEEKPVEASSEPAPAAEATSEDVSESDGGESETLPFTPNVEGGEPEPAQDAAAEASSEPAQDASESAGETVETADNGGETAAGKSEGSPVFQSIKSEMADVEDSEYAEFIQQQIRDAAEAKDITASEKIRLFGALQDHCKAIGIEPPKLNG